jgi:hypothetical protein
MRRYWVIIDHIINIIWILIIWFEGNYGFIDDDIYMVDKYIWLNWDMNKDI